MSTDVARRSLVILNNDLGLHCRFRSTDKSFKRSSLRTQGQDRLTRAKQTHKRAAGATELEASEVACGLVYPPDGWCKRSRSYNMPAFAGEIAVNSRFMIPSNLLILRDLRPLGSAIKPTPLSVGFSYSYGHRQDGLTTY